MSECFEVGDIVPGTHYEVVEFVGAGGSSMAYAVRDKFTHQQRIALVPNGREQIDPDRVKKLHGIKSPGLAGLLHIVPLDNGRSLFVTEFAGGAAPTELPLAPAALLSAAKALCDAVAQLHEHDIVHGDIAPQNVLVTPAGAAKLIDTVFRGRGTIAFRAPEVVNGGETTAESDCYALGGLLANMAAKSEASPYVGIVRDVARRLTESDPGARMTAAGACKALRRGLTLAEWREVHGKPPPAPWGDDGRWSSGAALPQLAPPVSEQPAEPAADEPFAPPVPAPAAVPRHAPPPVPVEPAPVPVAVPRTGRLRATLVGAALGVSAALAGVALASALAGGTAPEPEPPVSPPAAAPSLAAPVEPAAAPVVAAPSAPVVAPAVVPVKARTAARRTPTPHPAAPAEAAPFAPASAPAAETEPARAQPVVTPADGRARVDGAPTSTTRRYEDGGVEINNNYSPTINITH